MLENRDYTIIVDKSGSMCTKDMPGGKTRWEAVQEATFALASKCETYDPDGITLYTFASNFKRYDNVTSGKINDVWKENDPMGSTQLDTVLKDALDDYFGRKSSGKTKENGDLIVVVTDGEPNDRDAVSKVIIEATKKMDKDEELAILFFQVGRDEGATHFLDYLDDNLVSQGAKFDIVDTTKWSDAENMTLNELLLKAIED